MGSNAISVADARDKEVFMRMFDEREHVIIRRYGRFFLAAHKANSIEEACAAAKKSYEQGFSPCPGGPPPGVQDIDRFWDNLESNLNDVSRWPRSVVILTKKGVPVAVLQNFVNGIEDILVSKAIERFGQYPPQSNSATSKTADELLAEPEREE